MKVLLLFLAYIAQITLALDRAVTADRRVLKRSTIKLRSNTGESGGSCTDSTCPNTTTIVTFAVVFGVIGLICACYCIAACYKEYSEE